MLWQWFVANVWPNLFASGICTTFGLVWHHRRLKQHVNSALAAHHDQVVASVKEAVKPAPRARRPKAEETPK